MTTQMRSYGRGLRMPLLALTASASIVGGIFVAAQPAYSVDGVAGVTGQCHTVTDEGASIVVSSVVPVGSPLHVEGSGWGPSSESSRGFVVVTLDDGQEVRPDASPFPPGFPRLSSAIRLPGASPKCRPPALLAPTLNCRRRGRLVPSIRS